MKFIQEHTEVEPENFEEVWYNKDGKEISGENEKFYARRLTKNGNPAYYVREYSGTLMNPAGIFANKRFHTEEIRMVKVDKDIFDYYMMFLKTKNQIHLTRAERGRLNG